MSWLLDTHIWIWQLTDPDRLDAELQVELDDPARTLYLSAISVWEAHLLVERKRIATSLSPREWVESALDAAPVSVLDVSDSIALQSRNLIEYPHQDPADRFIVATALVHDLTLVTRDRTMLDWGRVPTR